MATPCVEVCPTVVIRRGKKEETAQLQFTYLLDISHVTHQNLIGYISVISKPIQFWFSPKLSAVQGLQRQLQQEMPHTSAPISKF